MKRIQYSKTLQFFQKYIDVLFRSDSDMPEFQRTKNAFLLGVYLFGIMLWGQLFAWGNFPFEFHDWAKVTAPRLAFIQDALRTFTFPLHMPGSWALQDMTDRFFQIPDSIFSPDMLLLGFLDIGTFSLVHVLLLYTIGFWGLNQLRKNANLSLILFTILFFLFFFNGHLIAHLSVGHLSWGGSLLFPCFLAILYPIYQKGEIITWKWVGWMSLTISLVIMQGSIHQMFWLFMVLGFLGITNLRSFPSILLTGVLALCTTLIRILPAFWNLGGFDKDFLGGFPRWHDLFEALIFERLPQTFIPLDGSGLRWWEFDHFIGYGGLLFLALGIVLWIKNMIKNRALSPWLLPILAILYLSIDDNYQPLFNFSLPIFSSERVTSRFALLPLLMLAMLSASYIQLWLDQIKQKLWVKIGLALGTLYLAYDLSLHTIRWNVINSSKVFPIVPLDLSSFYVANHTDPLYTNLIIIGTILSIVYICLALLLTTRNGYAQFGIQKDDC
ncbi:MAG: hypothetical protein JEZ06_06375 [Anaerolineaceae bacterium]|nr:hypothetical protein [Anaerolineaceae bacterium]